VKDNGAGIDPEILRSLSTKISSKLETGGTVLDLFISKAIIESYGDRYGLRIMQMAQELLIL
jgi:hypothetical protein